MKVDGKKTTPKRWRIGYGAMINQYIGVASHRSFPGGIRILLSYFILECSHFNNFLTNRQKTSRCFVNFWLHPRAPFPCGSRVFPKMCSRFGQTGRGFGKVSWGFTKSFQFIQLYIPGDAGFLPSTVWNLKNQWRLLSPKTHLVSDDLDKSCDTGPPMALQWCWGRDEMMRSAKMRVMTAWHRVRTTLVWLNS